LFLSISQVIGCEDHLRLDCVWGVKLLLQVTTPKRRYQLSILQFSIIDCWTTVDSSALSHAQFGVRNMEYLSLSQHNHHFSVVTHSLHWSRQVGVVWSTHAQYKRTPVNYLRRFTAKQLVAVGSRNFWL